MARQPAGRPGLSDELVALAQQWAEESCLDQELPTKITDPATIAQVATLLGVTSPVDRRPAAPTGEAPKDQRAA